MSELVEVRRGAYHDSVSLMQASRSVGQTEGVHAALVAMGTELNLDLLTGMGFGRPDGVGPNDLVVAVRAVDEDALAVARNRLDEALAALTSRRGQAGGFGEPPPPRTIAAAVAHAPAPRNLALVSVPGRYAFAEAMDALSVGLSVLVFSDNVPVAQEVGLKDEGARRGLLVMGPDCGTAAVAGVGLGFANVVRPGPVGLVASSGTGAQQLMCLLDAADIGVSHVLGVGGRDLSAEVGGRSTVQALAALDADPATELVLVVGKPPAAEVADRVREVASTLSKPVLFALVAPGQPDLTAVAEQVAGALGHSWRPPRSWPAAHRADTDRADTDRADTDRAGRPAGALRGLFAGGTLCDEAMVLASAALTDPVRSNIPLHPDLALGDDLRSDGHVMVDFGDDRLTQGRPHPMIDQQMRVERVLAEGADPSAGVLLLDVVLGHGAHPDPASELAPALTEARGTAREDGRDLQLVVSLCGTTADPQRLDEQADQLVRTGASVHLSNAEAARVAVALVSAGSASAGSASADDAVAADGSGGIG